MARHLASRLVGGGTGGGGEGQCITQPRGQAVAIVPLAMGGAWCAVRHRGWAAPVQTGERGKPLSLTGGELSDFCSQEVVPGASSGRVVWAVARIVVAATKGDRNRRVVWPQGSAAAALVAATKDDVLLSLVAGRRRSSCWPWVALGTLSGLASRQQRRECRRVSTTGRSASRLGSRVTPAGRGWQPARCLALRLDGGGTGGSEE